MKEIVKREPHAGQSNQHFSSASGIPNLGNTLLGMLGVHDPERHLATNIMHVSVLFPGHTPKSGPWCLLGF